MTADTSPERVAELVAWYDEPAAAPDAAELILALAAERDAWREIAQVKELLLTHQGASSMPPEKVWQRLDDALAALNETGDDTP